MDATKKPAPRSLSRTVVAAVVGLLIVVAVSGIVLAGRKAPVPAESGAAPTTLQVPAATTASAPPAAVTASDALPGAVRFADASDALPPEASGDLARFADAARAGGQQVGLTARFVAGADMEAAMALGRKRAEAVQHALQSNGISASRIQVEMIGVPAGALPAAAAGQVELALR